MLKYTIFHDRYFDSSLLLGVPLETLLFVGVKSVETPESFHIHPHLKKTHVEARMKKLESGGDVDWATAEALAIGSLLYQGWSSSLSNRKVRTKGKRSKRHPCNLIESDGEGQTLETSSS